ncbi:MAG: SMP-30/gluconolactonase/LRE family protein [Verrucomicrobiae bacterium]|nr:SMP-30/gluconolactonase/LRE family protein [Verrucomicrobiae bacterium]
MRTSLPRRSLPIFAFALAGLAAVPHSQAQDWADGLKIEGRVAFTEGPAWQAATGNVFFSDVENNRIMRLDPTGKVHIYRTPSGRANGLAFDSQGRLHACEGGNEGGNRRVTRTEADGSITILTDQYQGKKYNSPNDLVIDRKGRVFFTDPRYGDQAGMEIFDDYRNPIEGVYRIDPDGSVTQIISHEVQRPNGIAVSADGRFLFVADNLNSGPNDGVGGNRKLWRFDLKEDGSIDPASRKLLFDWGTERGPDGLAIGPDGNVYAAAGFNFPNPPAETADKYRAGIYVISPDSGKLVAFHAVPEDMVTNCTFGGADGRTLYLTAGHKLWSLPIK